MRQLFPRVVLAGTHSGCGKTTLVCGILQALVNRGLTPGAFKTGPDYIDPMFHSQVIGAKSANLDSFFLRENTLKFLLARNAQGCDVSLLEGVMGYYDGLGITTGTASTYQLASLTQTPVVLAVDAAGAALSVLAVIRGFADFRRDSGIQGVILNRCSAMVYPALAKAIFEEFGGAIRPLGYLPKMPEAALESRHLGLVTPAELTDLKDKLQALAAQVETSVDLEGLLRLAAEAPALTFQPEPFSRQEPVRIGVARDRAFCFYYADNLRALEELGGELVPFSPLTDPALPENLQGLYIGGGYPELYTRQLAENESMRRSVKQALERGLPCIAECGGFMYLTQAIAGSPMAGLLPGECADTGKLTRFGYVTLQARKDNLLCRQGQAIAAHEFHRWDCTCPGEDFTAAKPGGRSWPCAVATDTLYAGFPHFHFYANPDFVRNFYQACRKEKLRHAGNCQARGD